MRELKNLQELTGQESGIVMYPNGNVIICNWSSFGGLPRVFVTGLIGSDEILGVAKEYETDNIAELVAGKEIIYDTHNAAEDLDQVPGTVYELDNDVVIIAPKGWN